MRLSLRSLEGWGKLCVTGLYITGLCFVLAGCLSTLEDSLEQAEADAIGLPTAPTNAVETQPIAPLDAPPQIRASTAASLSRLGFAPIDGVPQAVERDLADSLRRAAFRRSMFLVPNGDRTQTHIVKGYLSLATNTVGTVLVYVWDISSNDGRPAQRLTGQILANGGDGSWASINKTSLDQLAVQSMEAIIGFLNTQMATPQPTQNNPAPLQ